MVSASNIPKYFQFYLSPSVLIFSWFGCSIPSVMYYFPLLIASREHFSTPNSILISWLYIPTACNKVFNSFSFLAKSLMSSIYIWWIIFSNDLWSLRLPVHFLSIWLSDIIAITNSNGDSAYNWNIPFCILTSCKLFFPAINSTLHFFMVSSVTLVDILYIYYYPALRDHIICLL